MTPRPRPEDPPGLYGDVDRFIEHYEAGHCWEDWQEAEACNALNNPHIWEGICIQFGLRQV